MSGESTPKTAGSARAALLEKLRIIADYWAKTGKPPQEIADGVVHSVLCVLDGESVDFPAVDIVLRPNETDKQDAINSGDDWFVDGQVINDCMLHEEFSK